jgi:hypothetical protein
MTFSKDARNGELLRGIAELRQIAMLAKRRAVLVVNAAPPWPAASEIFASELALMIAGLR